MFSIAFVPAIITVMASFVLFRFLSKGVMVSEFDSFGFINLVASFSIAMVVSLYSLGQISLDDVLRLGALFVAFYIGIFVVAIRYRSLVSAAVDMRIMRALLSRDALSQINVYVFGVGVTVLTVLFSIMLFSSGQMLDDRILLAKSFREIDLIRQGLMAVFPFYAIGMYLLEKRKVYLYMVVLTILASFFSGSKGFLLSYVIAYFTMDELVNGKRGVFDYLKRAHLLVMVFLSAVMVKIFWGDDIVLAAYSVFYRFFASGDVYYYAYVVGDYKLLYDKYNIFSYLLHPFTALVGVRGYDWPLGVALFEQVTGDSSGYGPNAQWPILILVLLKGSFAAAVAVSILVGALVALSRVYALKLLGSNKIPPFWRMSLFTVFFSLVPILFIDIGLFQQGLIAVLFVAFIMSIFYELMGVKYSKVNLNADIALSK